MILKEFYASKGDEEFKHLMQEVSEGVILVGLDEKKILFHNHAFEGIFGKLNMDDISKPLEILLSLDQLVLRECPLNEPLYEEILEVRSESLIK